MKAQGVSTGIALGPRLQELAPLPLRLTLGFGFLFHGYPKLFTAEGNEAFVGMLSGLGAPVPSLTAYLGGGLEFFGGILLILGVGVRVVSILGGVEMLIAIFMVYGRTGFDLMDVTSMTADGAMPVGSPGYEVSLLYLTGFVSLLISGAGALSLPSVRQVNRDRADEAREAQPPGSEAKPPEVDPQAGS
ncbi:MAG TPA: DoxX family protein [Longimicrobiales bacterium]|nr:DoxX family protein [Longimicrobiales bacterium]